MLSFLHKHSLQMALTFKRTPVRNPVLQLRAVDYSGAIMKGNRQHGGPLDEERQVGAWLSCPE